MESRKAPNPFEEVCDALSGDLRHQGSREPLQQAILPRISFASGGREGQESSALWREILPNASANRDVRGSGKVDHIVEALESLHVMYFRNGSLTCLYSGLPSTALKPKFLIACRTIFVSCVSRKTAPNTASMVVALVFGDVTPCWDGLPLMYRLMPVTAHTWLRLGFDTSSWILWSILTLQR